MAIKKWNTKTRKDEITNEVFSFVISSFRVFVIRILALFLEWTSYYFENA